ncbi:MAG: YaeQ family protein [Chthoniobacter sp.]|uniref:YaeQ family protein n=1 Tax=Chthoniobacter sp. TaxID=2510640 RepID=UPI0032A71741
MALKATIYKATIQVADMDRQVYSDHELTMARHPSETDERMLIRLLAFALNAPVDNDHGALEFAKDMWDAEEPALWQKDLTGQMLHWIEVGQPDEKRLLQCSSRSRRASVYSFASSTGQWWSGIGDKIAKARHLSVWQVPSEQSKALAALADRSMKLDVTVQDGTIWVGDGRKSLEVSLVRLFGSPES